MKKIFIFLLMATLSFVTAAANAETDTAAARIAKENGKRQVEANLYLLTASMKKYPLTKGNGIIIDRNKILLPAHMFYNQFFYQAYQKDLVVRISMYKDDQIMTIFGCVGKIEFQGDLALLELKGDDMEKFLGKFSPIEIAESISVGEELTTLVHDLRVGATTAVIKAHVIGLSMDKDEFCFGAIGGIIPGFSGGAIYNSKGQLVGMISRNRHEATGFGYAKSFVVIRDFLSDQNSGKSK